MPEFAERTRVREAQKGVVVADAEITFTIHCTPEFRRKFEAMLKDPPKAEEFRAWLKKIFDSGAESCPLTAESRGSDA